MKPFKIHFEIQENRRQTSLAIVTETQLMLCEKQNTSHFHVCYNSTSRLQAIQMSKKCKQLKHRSIQQKIKLLYFHSLTSINRQQLFCISSQDKNSRFSFFLFPTYNFTATWQCLNEQLILDVEHGCSQLITLTPLTTTENENIWLKHTHHGCSAGFSGT